MEKKIRKRYHSKEAVKKALKIDSSRNLTKDKVMEFTSMIPYMEKEVALEIIKEFQVYVEFVESAIENYTQLCKTILETNKEEYEQAVHAHQYVLETFANQLEQENLTEEERRDFSEKMIEEADKITELYLQQQKFHERVLKTIGGVVTLALGVTVTMLGLKAIGSDEDLPQLDDENQNVGGMNHYDSHGHKTGSTRPGILGGANHYDDKGHKTGHSNPGILSGWNHYDD